jgi:IS30 family transposase
MGKLSLTWSPEQIANTVTLGKVSFKTIYNWLYSGKLIKTNVTALRQKEVKERKTFGHWELDSMVSSRGESKGCFATFVERKSRLYTAFKTPNRTSESMKEGNYATLSYLA